MNKRELSERDICTKFITPAIQNAGWNIKNQIREEYTFTDGRVLPGKTNMKRGTCKRADYLLCYKPHLPLAIIEAKKNIYSVGAGIQQALNYGDILQVPFVYSSNGDGFIEHDRLTGTERELSLDEFPSPEALWQRYKKQQAITKEQEAIITEPYYFISGSKSPRYYQLNAINRTIEAIAKGQNRILLVMATGTGKTYTAFQVVHRLWSSKQAKKILFLADRNILVDQTMDNDFRPFKQVMTKIENHQVDASYDIYFALYQQLTGKEEQESTYMQFSPDFFDVIVVDECHRGSAKEDSNWRKILNYFHSAIQIGLTATPKETEDISNMAYFGEPVYTYSLKQGIDDGFLAPYTVYRIGIDRDLEGYRPSKGKYDKYGYLIEDRDYTLSDYDKNLILEKRTELVAKKITEFLKSNNRFWKTIVFCTDIDHAARMRQALVNENKDLVAQDHRYVMQITGDNPEGKAQLDNFIDPQSLYPTIVTTSELLTTGVDCKTCKLIVLDSTIESMTKFKQIIGRGTRINESYDKLFFTIMDFRNNSQKFSDPDFDGEPFQIYTGGTKPVLPATKDPFGDQTSSDPSNEASPRSKYYIQDVEARVIDEWVEYYNGNGQLVRDDLRSHVQKVVLKEYESLHSFMACWNATLDKASILLDLSEKGAWLDLLRETVLAGDSQFDSFDLICHFVYGQELVTRIQRSETVKDSQYFKKYSLLAQNVILALIEKYSRDGIEDFNDIKLLKLEPFVQFGNPMKITEAFGGKNAYFEAVKELEKHLYTV